MRSGVTLYYLPNGRGSVCLAEQHDPTPLARVLDNKAPSLKENNASMGARDLKRVDREVFLTEGSQGETASPAYTTCGPALCPAGFASADARRRLGTRFLAGALDTSLLSRIAASPIRSGYVRPGNDKAGSRSVSRNAMRCPTDVFDRIAPL